jgi:putative PIN family toxin of toxin-antitoxin system
VRVVFDTNVFISALITRGGSGGRAFLAAVEGRIDLAVSVPLLTETANVLTAKFHWERTKVDRAVRLIAATGTLVRPARRLSVCDHEPDNRVLECAHAAGADLIVTGDRHLLDLGSYKRIRIVTLVGFLQVLGEGT